MPTRFFPLPPDIFKDDFLRTLAEKFIQRNETLSARASQTAPMAGEDNNATEKHPTVKDSNLTIDYSTKKGRQQAFNNIAFDHANVCLPIAASNDDHRGD